MRGGHILWHVADFKVVDETPEEQQETEQQENPPEPVLTIKVASEVVGEPDDKNPLDEGKSEAADSSIASCDGIGQTEGQAEPNPVEQEGHEKSQHEDSIVPNSKLIRVTEVVSGWEFIIPRHHLHSGGSHGGRFGLLRFVICGQRSGDAVGRRHWEVTSETSLGCCSSCSQVNGGVRRWRGLCSPLSAWSRCFPCFWG